MPSGTRKCKICGCEYPYCKTITHNRFRYQDVACSPEHAAEYFRRIELSRMTDTPAVDYSAGLIEDEEGELFEEDFEDEEDELFDEDFEDEEEEIEIET